MIEVIRAKFCYLVPKIVGIIIYKVKIKNKRTTTCICMLLWPKTLTSLFVINTMNTDKLNIFVLILFEVMFNILFEVLTEFMMFILRYRGPVALQIM